jgi:hypothetical protein
VPPLRSPLRPFCVPVAGPLQVAQGPGWSSPNKARDSESLQHDTWCNDISCREGKCCQSSYGQYLQLPKYVEVCIDNFFCLCIQLRHTGCCRTSCMAVFQPYWFPTGSRGGSQTTAQQQVLAARESRHAQRQCPHDTNFDHKSGAKSD